MARQTSDVKKKDAGKLRQDTLKNARSTLASMRGKTLSQLSTAQRNNLLITILQMLDLADADGKIL